MEEMAPVGNGGNHEESNPPVKLSMVSSFEESTSDGNSLSDGSSEDITPTTQMITAEINQT